MVSDNGKTFVAGSKIITKIIEHPAVEQYLSDNCIQWKFNLERALWWGGIFERMIRSVKRCLKKTIGRAKLTLDEFTTATIEVDNCRPLSYVSTEDTDEPLTPSHIIAPRQFLLW